MIVGRSAEQSRINRLVADAKDGHSRSLVLRGEAGIGKTALLDYAESVAGRMRVLRVVGIESEAEVAYAALQLMFVRGHRPQGPAGGGSGVGERVPREFPTRVRQ